MAIIPLMTLFFALFLPQTIITIIFFEDFYHTYFFYVYLLLLFLLRHYYWHCLYSKLLLLLSFLKPIILIILFSHHYLHYCNYGDRKSDISDISDIIAIKYIWSLLLMKVDYGYRYWIGQSASICTHQRQLLQHTYCGIQAVSAPPFWPTVARHPRERSGLHCLQV